MQYLNIISQQEASLKLLMPKIQAGLPGKVLLNTELHKTPLATELDRNYCTDLIYQLNKDQSLRFIALRAQPVGRAQSLPESPESFTIRLKVPTGIPTEYDKLEALAKREALGNHLHLHGYYDTRGLISFGLIKSLKLFRFIQEHRPQTVTLKNEEGGSFLVIPWDTLELAGVGFVRWKRPLVL